MQRNDARITRSFDRILKLATTLCRKVIYLHQFSHKSVQKIPKKSVSNFPYFTLSPYNLRLLNTDAFVHLQKICKICRNYTCVVTIVALTVE